MRNTVLSAALVAASLAVAPVAQAKNNAFDGAYFGGQIGYDSYTLKNKSALFGETNLGGNGFEGGLFAGYNARVNNVVLGLEGQFALTDADVKAGFNKIRAKETFGISARAGVLLTDSALLYVNGGWINTRFKEYGLDLDGTAKTSLRRNGWTLGTGVEVFVSDNMSVRAQYTYNQYKRFENNGFRARNNQFQLGGAWHF